MKTKIKFKAIRGGRIVYKTIPIEHPKFEPSPPIVFDGVQLPETPIEHQIMEYLDEIDKSDIMVKYDFDVILDYWIPKKRAKANEIEEFFAYMQPLVDASPDLRVPLERIIESSLTSTLSKALAVSCEAHKMTLVFPLTSFCISFASCGVIKFNSEHFSICSSHFLREKVKKIAGSISFLCKTQIASFTLFLFFASLP